MYSFKVSIDLAVRMELDLSLNELVLCTIVCADVHDNTIGTISKAEIGRLIGVTREGTIGMSKRLIEKGFLTTDNRGKLYPTEKISKYYSKS